MTDITEEQLWNTVYEERTSFFERYYGQLPDDILKIGHMSGVWPGGGLFKFKAPKLGNDYWVYTTFGFSNPDMPTGMYPSNINNEHEDNRLVKTELTLTKKENVPSYPGRPGYGYEIMVITIGEKEWPLWFLQWAANAEILNDADILGRVNKYEGLTIEDITIGIGQYTNVLISNAAAPFQNTMKLSNGEAKLLIATPITDDEMRWSMKNGRKALLKKLMESGSGQVSDLDRVSVLNSKPVAFSEIDSIEKAEQLAGIGLLRKIYLFPLEFGGQDIQANTVYVSKNAALAKKDIDQKVMGLAQQGKINNYSAKPSYNGSSAIPSSIEIEASGESRFIEVIDVY